MDVHVRDLRYFAAVARELSFTRAAERLYLSQPALSKQIRALERRLDVTLFDREPDGVRLTRAGAELLPHAEEIVASWEEAERSLARASSCTLVIGMHTSPGPRAAAARPRDDGRELPRRRSSSCARSRGATPPPGWPRSAHRRRVRMAPARPHPPTGG